MRPWRRRKRAIDMTDETNGGLPPDLQLSPDFGDVESLWNSRKWLEAALTAKGAKVTGAGMGGGKADIDIVLGGFKFNVTIEPR